jgi:membrane-bound ClpP family serine protease
MIRGNVAVAGALFASLAAVVVIAEPVQAGTCMPVTVKARAADPATATTKASIKLTQRAASLRGRIKNSSTNCQKGPPGGFVCMTSAVVCP